jgi:hypothetical protein
MCYFIEYFEFKSGGYIERDSKIIYKCAPQKDGLLNK